MTQTVCITRHGNRLDFVDPEWFKTAERLDDPPLSSDGVIQARELGQRLIAENVGHVFSSPFLRSVETAQEVASILNLSIKIETGLSEWLNPQWFPAMPEVLIAERLAQQFPRVDPSYRPRVPASYPESSERALTRAGTTAVRLVAEFSENILLVGHGASVLGATAGLLREPVKDVVRLLPLIRCCCLVKLVEGSGKWVMELAGDTSHLSNTEDVVRFV
jgi:broad specificity phosphatase PhoE